MPDQNHVFPEPQKPIEDNDKLEADKTQNSKFGSFNLGNSPRNYEQPLDDQHLVNDYVNFNSKAKDQNPIQTQNPPQTAPTNNYNSQAQNQPVYSQQLNTVYSPQNYPPNNSQNNQVPIQIPGTNPVPVSSIYSNPAQYNTTDFSTDFSVGIPEQPQVLAQTKSKNPNFIISKLKAFFGKYKLPLLVTVGVIVALLLTLVVISQFSKSNTEVRSSYNNVVAVIDGPRNLPQGSPGIWYIKITNNEPVPIENVVLDLQYDQDFQVTQFLNNKPSNAENNQFRINFIDGTGGLNDSLISIEGFLNAQVDLETIMKGSLTFTPKITQGQSAPKKNDVAGFRTKIVSPEVKLSIDPNSGVIQNSGEAEFVIRVKNTKEKDLQDLKLRLVYPSGNVFTYNSSQFVSSNTAQNRTSPDDGDDTWFISRLAGLSEQTLTLKGTVKVKSAQKVPFGVELSLKSNTGYKELSKAFKDIVVSSEPVIITTKLEDKNNSTFEPGETLKFSIDYVNQSQDLLKNIEIIGFVDDKSNLLDYNTIAFSGGSKAFASNNQIQWIGNNTPQLVSLAPQARGKLNYSIKVKKDVLDPSKNQSEYVINPKVKISGSNLQPIEGTGEVYKMKSNLRFSQNAKSEEIQVPDKQKQNVKRYRLFWQIQSEQNDIDNVLVRAFTRLPPSAFQKDSIKIEGIEGSKLEYNQNNGEITWKIDKVPAYSGNTPNRPIIKATFEIEIETKSNTNSTQSVTLVEAPSITAKDNFTGENFSLKGRESDTKK